MSKENLTAQERKERPLFTGLLKYFPNALMEVAHASFIGNQQHHPDKPLHWDKSKSTDEADALMRHLLQSGTMDTDGVRHTTKVAWRALALLEREIEQGNISTQNNIVVKAKKPLQNKAKKALKKH